MFVNSEQVSLDVFTDDAQIVAIVDGIKCTVEELCVTISELTQIIRLRQPVLRVGGVRGRDGEL